MSHLYFMTHLIHDNLRYEKSNWSRRHNTNICDIIFENLPYGGTNIIRPGQAPRVMRGVWSGPTIFLAHEHLQRAFLSLPAHFNHKYCNKHVDTPDPGGDCSFLHKAGFRRLRHIYTYPWGLTHTIYTLI